MWNVTPLEIVSELRRKAKLHSHSELHCVSNFTCFAAGKTSFTATYGGISPQAAPEGGAQRVRRDLRV